MTLTHYERLGIDPAASSEEIRLAYLRRARENHPDKLPGAGADEIRAREQAMVAINAAWFVLRDPDRRRLYDASLGPRARPPEVERPAPASPPSAHPEWAPGADTPDAEPSPDGTGYGNAAASIARLYAVVAVAVLILLGIAFAYAVVRSGTVGL